MRYNINRFIPNLSATVIKERFPFFVIPLSLMIFLLGFFLWTFFKVGNKNTKDTINYIENIVGSSPNKSYITYNNSLNSYEKQYFLGLDYFSNQNYQEAREIFKSLYLKRDLPSYIALRVGTYYAYTLMILGEKNYNERLIQDSQDIFADLYRNYQRVNDPLVIRVLLGYAKTSRLLNKFQINLIGHLKQSSIKVEDHVKKQIFLELGYIYSVNNSFKDAQDAFLRASLPITSVPLYAKLLTSNEAIGLTINLLRYNLVPKYLQSRVLGNLQLQMLNEATNLYKIRNIKGATTLLRNILVLYPTGVLKDNVNYLLGYYSQSSGNLKVAMQHYQQVGNKGSLNSAALYQMALISLKEGNTLQAQRYFYAVIKQNPKDHYAQSSYEWIQKIQNGQLNPVEFNDQDYMSYYLPTLNNQFENYVLPFSVPSLEIYYTPIDTNNAYVAPQQDKPQQNSSQPIINLNVNNGINDSNNQGNSRSTVSPSPNPLPVDNSELEALRAREKQILEEQRKRDQERNKEDQERLQQEKARLEQERQRLEDLNRKQLEELKNYQSQKAQAKPETKPIEKVESSPKAESSSNDSQESFGIFEEEQNDNSSSFSAIERDFNDLSSVVSKKY